MKLVNSKALNGKGGVFYIQQAKSISIINSYIT